MSKSASVLKMIKESIGCGQIDRGYLITEVGNPYFLRGVLLQSTGYKDRVDFVNLTVPWFGIASIAGPHVSSEYNQRIIQSATVLGDKVDCAAIALRVSALYKNELFKYSSRGFTIEDFIQVFFPLVPSRYETTRRLFDLMISSFLASKIDICLDCGNLLSNFANPTSLDIERINVSSDIRSLIDKNDFNEAMIVVRNLIASQQKQFYKSN